MTNCVCSHMRGEVSPPPISISFVPLPTFTGRRWHCLVQACHHEIPIGWNMRSLKSVTNSPSPTESTHKIILNYILSTCWKIIDVKDDTFVATLLSCFDGTLSGDVSCCMEYNLFGEEFIKWMLLSNLCSEKMLGSSYYHNWYYCLCYDSNNNNGLPHPFDSSPLYLH